MVKKIKVGQIWEVVSDNFYATIGGSQVKDMKSREVVTQLVKGEKFEIRYPFKWNYRTQDNIYLSSKPEYISENCKLFGIVKEDIHLNNKASLEEILRLELFYKV